MVHLLHRLYGVDAPGRDNVSTKLRRARLVLGWMTVFAHEYTTGFFLRSCMAFTLIVLFLTTILIVLTDASN